MLHWVLLGFSRFVARFVADRGYELYTKNDQRFLEGAYKLMVSAAVVGDVAAISHRVT